MWNTGKKIVITEGEIDALSVAEAQNCKWPTVSIPNGVNSAVKAVSKDIEWLLGFDEVVLMFDMDKVGQEAAKAVAEVFPQDSVKLPDLERRMPTSYLQKTEDRD